LNEDNNIVPNYDGFNISAGYLADFMKNKTAGGNWVSLWQPENEGEYIKIQPL